MCVRPPLDCDCDSGSGSVSVSGAGSSADLAVELAAFLAFALALLESSNSRVEGIPWVRSGSLLKSGTGSEASGAASGFGCSGWGLSCLFCPGFREPPVAIVRRAIEDGSSSAGADGLKEVAALHAAGVRVERAMARESIFVGAQLVLWVVHDAKDEKGNIRGPRFRRVGVQAEAAGMRVSSRGSR